jgi:hypothetical protein
MLSNLPPWKTRSNIRRFTLAARRETRASFFSEAKKPEPETAEAYKMADQKLRCKSG